MYFYRKYIKVILSLVLCVLMIFVSGCSALSGFERIKIDSDINFINKDNSFRTTEKSKLEKAASTDSISLYVDKSSGAVTLTDSETSFLWNSLPDFSNNFAAAFLLRVIYDNKLIELDSSYNAAKLGKLSFEALSNGIRIIYEFIFEELRIRMPVDFILQGAYLSLQIDIDAIECAEDVKIVSVSVLPFMGAVRYSAESFDYNSFDDYFLVPDGVGGLLYTALESEAVTKTYSVYSKQSSEDVENCAMGAFGVRQGSKALAVTVTDGAENALIKVVRSNADSRNINMIYPEFVITPISRQDGSVLAGASYNGTIGVCYDILVNDDADYIGIAGSVRQALVNADILPSARADREYPLFVSVTGSFDGTKKGTMTSFQQTEDLLTVLKAKGVNNINLILEGAFFSGITADASQGLILSQAQGSKEDFNQLCSYAVSQKLNVFMGVNYLSPRNAADSAKKEDGSAAERKTDNPFYSVFGDETVITEYISAGKLSASSKNLVEFSKEYNIAGFCLLDTAALAMDNSEDSGSFTGYNNALTSNLGALSAQMKLMMSEVTLNTVRNADYIKDVALYCESDDMEMEAIPFLPAVLHGAFIYSGTAANLGNVPRMQMLKSIEYGAVPYFFWTYKEDSGYFYENTLNEAVDFYLIAQKELGGLSDKRITDHFMYESGVYCTCYEGGVQVYVNYNNYSVLIGEVAVMPYDFLRIG